MDLKPLLIVLCGHVPDELVAEFGDFDRHFLDGLGPLAVPVRVVAAHRGETMPDPQAVAAVLVSGSRAMVGDAEPWMTVLSGWLRRAVAAEVPLLAVCFGHQLLAAAHGGQVGPRSGGIEYSSAPISLHPEAATDPLLSVWRQGDLVAERHWQSVLVPPPHAVLLAASPRDPHHAFRYGTQAWSVQCHPESTVGYQRAATRRQAQALRAHGEDAEALLADCRDMPAGSALLRRFAQVAGISAVGLLLTI